VGMHPFPHLYKVTAAARIEGDIHVGSPGLHGLTTDSPAEFGGPGTHWSPETLLVAAVADCFALTFRGIAAASRLPWVHLHCEADGTLERIDRVTRFTSFTIRATLGLPDASHEEQARRLLAKAEETCLVTRSLTAPTRLEVTLEVASAGIDEPGVPAFSGLL
jgi:organic hydroperoxide reductase OsmC/OhrA